MRYAIETAECNSSIVWLVIRAMLETGRNICSLDKRNVSNNTTLPLLILRAHTSHATCPIQSVQHAHLTTRAVSPGDRCTTANVQVCERPQLTASFYRERSSTSIIVRL